MSPDTTCTAQPLFSSSFKICNILFQKSLVLALLTATKTSSANVMILPRIQITASLDLSRRRIRKKQLSVGSATHIVLAVKSTIVNRNEYQLNWSI